MKIKIVQLFTNLDDKREKRSLDEISKLSNYGIPYHSIVNKIWTDEIPEEQRQCNLRPFTLTKAHYGCYRAHKDAITEYLTHDIDGLFIFECDAVMAIPIEEFVSRMYRVATICKDFDLLTFTMGFKHGGKTISKIEHDVITISQFIETHSYYVPIKSREIFMNMFSKPWDALDYCYTIYFYDQMQYKIGTFNDRPICVQGDGLSLIDNKIKTSENIYRETRYEK